MYKLNQTETEAIVYQIKLNYALYINCKPLSLYMHDTYWPPYILLLRGVGDKPMSCKPGVAGSIPGFSQSVG